ncbi:putative ATP-dependent RNA helicase [Neolecta irregularis DAH-3]|uniref:RNA helicase n=1 Tax=Neolecta irregularis (strain DAH-3) TaxID=1198029 RepID=A0A1U7LNZ1_NEOID|nr:putative ATP-dependent RNA helicase [Neolecta irregularis DAH-3]|eukprot:OLL24262.1 putative ATP-dependent RNA helicase [Neolecta irregularis DAH-3]
MDTPDPNAILMMPVSKAERQKRKEILRAEAEARKPESKISAKKKKRLDKYIEAKMRKEEKAMLIQKLSKSKIDHSMMQKTKELGKKDKPRKEKPLQNQDIVEEHDKAKVPGKIVPKCDEEPVNIGSGLKRRYHISSNVQPKRKKLKMGLTWREKLQARVQTPESNISSFDPASDQESDQESKHSSEPESENTMDEDTRQDLRARGDRFKAWAIERTVETSAPVQLLELPLEIVSKATSSRPRDRSETPEEISVSLNPSTVIKTTHVTVTRTQEIEESRMLLPVVSEEQRIMEVINHNPCVVLCGQTGSGKTTQVPQFLYEAGYGSLGTDNPGMIGITQPRRVAAVSMASRLKTEMGDAADRVGYQIRFDSACQPETAIKFMTDGVLLRELATDFLLTRYSVVIVDEAHERSINTDILIGILSRVLKVRAEMSQEEGSTTRPLKLIIMSATLRVSDFVENKTLFGVSPPVIKIDARQFPVTTHFAKRTSLKYVDDVYKKVCKIHNKLPPGGILVFLTGQGEIRQLCSKLKKSFCKTSSSEYTPKVRLSGREVTLEAEDVDFGNDIQDEENSEAEEFEESSSDEMLGCTSQPLHLLPLYSLLPTSEQLKVFQAPPTDHRLCVVATNVAETSITIPGIRYVVDSGKVKEKSYNRDTGVQSYDVKWISRASAEQRSGRAGRTGPGHCYRLYSSAVYERDFNEFTMAEINRAPIEGTVLQMKNMNIDQVVKFPFPTPPESRHLREAEELLSCLGALDSDGRITELGQSMAAFPLSPRFAKMLTIGGQHGCLPYVISIVAGLSVGSPFLEEFSLAEPLDVEDEKQVLTNEQLCKKEQRKRRRKEFFVAQQQFMKLDPMSDVLKLLSVICAFIYSQDKQEFCEKFFLRPKAMEEIDKLRKQLTEIVLSNSPVALGRNGTYEKKPSLPKSVQIKAIRQIVAAGFSDQAAVRADLVPSESIKEFAKGFKKGIIYVVVARSGQLETCLENCLAIVHSSSVINCKTTRQAVPDYIIYQELVRSSGGSDRVYIKPLTPISAQHLTILAKSTPLITYSKPLEYPRPVVSSDGMSRECMVVPRYGVGKGWELAPCKIRQKRVHGKWVEQ